jgi:hypothetical protein
MTTKDADQLRKWVQGLSLAQLCKLWRWITFELGAAIERDFKKGT